jgi:hypothetical protein
MTRSPRFVRVTNLSDQPWKIARMNKFTYAIALGAGLVLSLTAPKVQADPIVQTLTPATISAAQFNTDFTPVTTVLSQPYAFINTNSAGVVESQVFQGKGALAGLYAYAYQFGVNNVTDTSTNQPTSVNSASMLFNATPLTTNQIVPGTTSATYVVTDGQVGQINVPQAAPGTVVQTPASIAWLPGTSTGSLTFQYLNPTTNSSPLGAGATSGTVVVISNQPHTQQFVSVQNPEPQTTYPKAFSPSGGPIEQVPAPEPATVLAWASVIAALAVGHHIRRARKVVVA